jgi:RHS repeat-associated protein
LAFLAPPFLGLAYVLVCDDPAPDGTGNSYARFTLSESPVTFLMLQALSNPYPARTYGGPGWAGDYYMFQKHQDGTYGSYNEYRAVALPNEQGWEIRTPGGLVNAFDDVGRLVQIRHASGHQIDVTCLEGDFTNPQGYTRYKIDKVEHSNGKYLEFVWSGNRIWQVKTPDPNIYVEYVIDPVEGDLQEVNRHTARGTFSTTYRYRYRMYSELYPEGSGQDEELYSLHWLRERINANGDVFTYTYEDTFEASARATGMDVNGSLYKTIMEYPAVGTTIEKYVRDGTTLTTEHKYDALLKKVVRSEIAADPNMLTSRAYDPWGNPTQVKVEDLDTESWIDVNVAYDPGQFPTNFSVAYGPPSPVVHAWTQYWDHVHGVVTQYLDPEGVTVEIDYNDLALPEEIRLPDGASTHTTTFGYDASGNLAAITNANGHVTAFTHTAAGYLESVVPPVGPWYKVQSRYPNGFPTSIYRYEGLSSSWRILILPDEQGRPLRIIRQGPGAYTSEYFTYDAYGNLLTYKDPAGRTSAFTYELGKLTSASRPVGGVPVALATIDYDTQLNAMSITDPLQRGVESYVLDNANRVVEVDNLEGQTMTVDYHVAGLVSHIDRFDGSGVDFDYNGQALLNNVDYGAIQSAFTYYDNGQLHTAVNEAGTVSLSYRPSGRLWTENGAALASTADQVAYTYDPVGNLTGLSHLGGQYTATYDDAERIETLDGPEGGFDFGYDPASGLLEEISYPGTITATFTYDGLDRLTDITYTDDAQGVLRSRTYAYNSLSLITAVDEESGARTEYAYDDLDRLILADPVAGGGDEYVYEYDLAGNRTTTEVNSVPTTWTLEQGNNRLDNWGSGTDITYDTAGNVDWMQFADSRELDLIWNARYQLTAVKVDDVPTESYTYDALGRRVSTTAGATTTYHVYAGMDVVADTDASGNLLRSYVHGPGVDDILAMTIHFGPNAGTYFYLKDHLGSVLALTDDDGDIVESYDYDPYGNITARGAQGQPLTASAYGNRHTFQGREYSWTSRIYHFRTRWYEPITGRWLSKDLIGISGGSNQFEFCQSMPTLLNDPWGLDSVGIISGGDHGAHKRSARRANDYVIYADNLKDILLGLLELNDRGVVVTQLRFHGHGSRTGQKLGPQIGNYLNPDPVFMPAIGALVEPTGSNELVGCHAGSLPGYLQGLADSTGRTTYGYLGPVKHPSIFQLPTAPYLPDSSPMGVVVPKKCN